MPLSRDPVARSRQIANLKQGGNPPPPPGGRTEHRGYAVVSAERMEAKVCEVFDALALDTPLRDADGGLPREDAPVVQLLAECLCRLDDVRANIRDYGAFDRKTHELRPVVAREAELRREAFGYMEAIGNTPRSRVKLGLDLGRGASLAQMMSAAGDGGDDVVEGEAHDEL